MANIFDTLLQSLADPSSTDLTLDEAFLQDQLINDALMKTRADQNPAPEPATIPEPASIATPALEPVLTSTPTSTKSLSPQEEKAALLQKKWGKQGFTFEVDEKGQMVISNTNQTRAAVGITESDEGQNLLGKNLQASINAIKAEKNPEARASLYQNLQVQAAAEKAKYWNEAMGQAGNKLGVPQLEAALAQNEALDRQDPRWAEFQTDSPITAKLRAQLNTARGLVDNEARNMLAGNVGLASLNAQMTAATKLLERQERLGEQLDLWKEQKQFSQEIREEEENKRLLETVSPEMIARASVIDPSLNGKSAEAIARHIVKGVKDKGMQRAIVTPDEDLANLTFAGDNKFAAKVLMKKEEERTGRTQGDIADQMKAIHRSLTDDKQLRKDLSIVYRGDKKAQEDILSVLTRAKLGGTKAEKEAAQQQRVALTMAIQSKMAEAAFKKDMRQWKGYDDPEMLGAIEKAASTTGKTSMDEVLAVYLGELTGIERRARVDRFLANLRLAGEAGPSNSLLKPIDVNSIAIEVQALAIQRSLIQRMGIQNSLSLAPTPLMKAPVLGAEMAYDALANFFGAQK